MPEFTELPLDEIRVAHFNPARRVERNSLTGLILSIKEHGILNPLDLAADRTLADGHRRYAAAHLLKLPCAPVAIHSDSKLDAAALWVLLNNETMALTPRQWLAAIDSGLPLDTPGFPDILKRRVEKLIELVGKDGISMLVENGRSPYIIDSAERVVKFCERRDDDEFFKQAVDWLIYVGNSFNVRTAIEEDIPPDVLVEAIQAAKPLTRMWGVEK